MPLVASSVGTDQLLGGPGTRPAAVDALAARTLVKGEALSPPAGRADDFSWPRREVGRELAKDPVKEPKDDTPVASTSPVESAPATPGPGPQKQLPQLRRQPAQPAPPAQSSSPFGNFFGFGNPAPAPRQFAPPPRAPAAPFGIPRPPAAVGRSASVTGNSSR
jgi:uncharacterized protein